MGNICFYLLLIHAHIYVAVKVQSSNFASFFFSFSQAKFRYKKHKNLHHTKITCYAVSPVGLGLTTDVDFGQLSSWKTYLWYNIICSFTRNFYYILSKYTELNQAVCSVQISSSEGE